MYVNGRPLVLREDERPFKNMQVRTHPHALPHVWGREPSRGSTLLLFLCGATQERCALPWHAITRFFQMVLEGLHQPGHCFFGSVFYIRYC